MRDASDCLPQRLPFPFPGSFRDQNVFNNYQQPTDGYVHAALDIMQDAGTEVPTTTTYKYLLSGDMIAVVEPESRRVIQLIKR